MLDDKAMLEDRAIRLFILYDLLSRNEVVNRENIAEKFKVSGKTIYRDIKIINYYIATKLGLDAEVRHSSKDNGYRLDNPLKSKLSKEETLAIVKIILESRAFSKPDMEMIVEKLINNLSHSDRSLLKRFFGNEKDHYNQTKNSKSLFKIIWEFSNAIMENRIINATYKKNIDKETVEIEIEPMSILFSEYYFYLISYIHKENPSRLITFRLDNFLSHTVTNTHFRRSHSIKNRFEEGEFRKRIQFMTTGNLITIEFEFWGRSLDAVTDRLSTAEIIRYNGDNAIVRAQGYERGLKMWLLSQADTIKVLKPPEFVTEMKQTISRMMDNYS